ncbi:coiled-coil domain-containing protein 89-like [Dreissena polymorpha]|uniref:Coiled-coil domain-containing protein 89 n=1 Tax=Dreissena polymorpha TaxID=45954 RepID=A0A9D4ICJ9_DREPO|nr:coiled-coil domain-containing protein 89-like [Dreissena polymorpha]XP_052235361.1 coiled-coil domain-containing protein 89-like [Dreissena polymorpha]XP_052235362.1 coiled-coil domain-containing protein 89-like [Dreissena polymorpha]XP_052235363.1 coiled-coil domain-containing protein 89-like [Dreissena polymorpha]XP_052235364.1 coiled-coil domain-containing protein 89-like [Dreissena polymorpha]XP_052235366.1 coiled-coil domain-containing protein 89-like [Dreissena polymorpha]XP_05223536
MEYSVQLNGQRISAPSSGDKASEGNKEISSLSKLKGLGKDDKTENAMLRSRIDEQSQLIMILKTRADEAFTRIQTLERINEELTSFRDNAKEQLQSEIRKFNILDGRFNDLASNHEEMIKYKDEYKRVNGELRRENDKLKDDNAKLFSKAIQEKDDMIRQLEGKLITAKDQCSTLDTKYKQAVQEGRVQEEGLRRDLHESEERLRGELRDLTRKLNDSEERLKAANYKLQSQLSTQHSADAEMMKKLQQVTKEKDELLDLAMQRGKIIQKEQTDNKAFKKRIEEMEKAVLDMQDKFEREAAAVNSNRAVKKLRDDLQQAESIKTEVTKEFEAYKKHTTALLKKEKELNERLRHLCG